MKSRWLPWKYQQAVGKGGAVVGLGTDVGSLAICYRKDLFAKAGLPTNRVAVSKLWPTWQAYINTGKRYQAKAPKGTFFFDTGSNVYNAMVGQLNPAYYNAAGQNIAATNPSIKAAYNLAMSGVVAGESAGLPAFSTDWNTGYKKGKFATVTCPAWMMGYIQGQAPATKGKWDIAATPGTGGNWGGSFLAVPKQGSHQDEAADLVKFLTSPASEAVRLQEHRQPAQPDGAAEERAGPELQEPLLQQRACRPGLRQFGAEAEAADPRPPPDRPPDRLHGRLRSGPAAQVDPGEVVGPVPQGRQEHRLGSPYAWRRRGEPVDGSSAPAPPASLKIHAFDGRRGRERGNRARAECAQGRCGPPPAAPPRRGRLALRLRRVVLRRLLRLRAVPARLHGVDVADRPQPAEPDDALRRARQLHRAPPRLLLLERGREHARDLGALHRPPAPARARASRI